MSDTFIGEIRLFGFQRVPTGWFACDGSQKSIAEYESLYVLIGTTFGGDGVSTFSVPDLRGRVPISQGTGRGLTPRVLGQFGGEQAHVLLNGEIPIHSHPLMSTTNLGTTVTPSPSVHLATVTPAPATLYAPAGNVPDSSALAACVGSTGNSLSHNNMMPTLTGNFCIAWIGVFPTPD